MGIQAEIEKASENGEEVSDWGTSRNCYRSCDWKTELSCVQDLNNSVAILLLPETTRSYMDRNAKAKYRERSTVALLSQGFSTHQPQNR